MKRLVVVALLAIGIAWLVVRSSTPEATLRYRMTVEVQTPSGPKSGSSVMELVLWQKRLIPLPGAGGSDWGGGFIIYGEAPFVDLGNDQVLFTTRHDAKYSPRREMTSVAFEALRFDEFRRSLPADSDAKIMNDLVKSKPFAVLKPERYPMLATFTNKDEPRSFVELAPDKLDAHFGPGTTLGRITLQVVDQSTPLTTALASRFPGLLKLRGFVALPPS